jgi:hypothetical protein
VKKTVMVIGSSSSSGSGSGVVQAGTMEATTPTSNPKATAKRTVMMIGSSGSSPPRKRFHATWTCQDPRYVMHFEGFLFLHFYVGLLNPASAL